MEDLYERLLEPVRPELNTPGDFLRAAVEYFRWRTEHPIQEEVVSIAPTTGRITRTHKSMKKVFTKGSMLSYLNLPKDTFSRLRAKGEDWAEAVERVEAVIEDDKFTGAVAGLYNANIISRDLGLADKQEISGPGGGPVRSLNINVEKMSTEALAELMDVYDDQDPAAE